MEHFGKEKRKADNIAPGEKGHGSGSKTDDHRKKNFTERNHPTRVDAVWTSSWKALDACQATVRQGKNTEGEG